MRGVFGKSWQVVIDLPAYGCDTIQGHHGFLHAREGFTLSISVEEGRDHCKAANKGFP